MKTVILSAAALLSAYSHVASAQAETSIRAALVSRSTASSVLVCKYVATTAKFEIVAPKGRCAPYIEVR